MKACKLAKHHFYAFWSSCTMLTGFDTVTPRKKPAFHTKALSNEHFYRQKFKLYRIARDVAQ
jgi:hypothetical protein